MEAFSYEQLTVLLVIVAFVVLCLEYLWLYLLSKKQEEEQNRKKDIAKRVNNCFEMILNAPTASARRDEAEAMISYLGDSFERKDEAARQLLEFNDHLDTLNEERLEALGRVLTAISPVELYAEQLKKGNDYEKGYACRKLADYQATDRVDDLRALLKNRNHMLNYHAAMALSQLGDEHAVAEFVQVCDKNHKYSHRVILELLQNYTGDRAALATRILNDCSDYIRAAVLKAYSDDALTSMGALYAELTESRNSQVKVAAVKALAALGDPAYEHLLATSLHDKNWIVRLAAVKGLAAIGSPTALMSLLDAVKDEEWWVRKTAADEIVRLDHNLIYVEKVLSGYDKYAADAVKTALYKAIRMTGGLQK